MHRLHPLLVTALSAVLAACSTGERCLDDRDCAPPLVCEKAAADDALGQCTAACDESLPCASGQRCVEGHCLPDGTGDILCAPAMVPVGGGFCIDTYEASRPDATAGTAGTDGSVATSRPGVLPWRVTDNAEAAAACAAAGKRLCTASEWFDACRGPTATAYPYGDAYDRAACNGLDTFDDGHFRLMPTGSFPDCTNEWGAFDLSGNVWEHVAGGDDTSVRGGAFNCGDSPTYHRCAYVPRTWTPSAQGFRCCAEPLEAGDGGVPDGGALDAGPGDGGDGDGGPDGGPEDAGYGDGGPADGGPEDAGPGDGGPEDGGSGDAGPGDGGPAPVDTDEDGVPDDVDNCPEHPNPAQEDADLDGWGDPCDAHTGTCPADMVPADGFCLDRYEASRPDATAQSAGFDGSEATSRPDVLPWMLPSRSPSDRALEIAEARDACAAAGKRLCTEAEWLTVCFGPGRRDYAYGATYDALTCNGIDTFCSCDPYPNCYWDCGAAFHLEPTGSFPDCLAVNGAFDVNGNLWELVDTDDGALHYHGGAFNCGDSPRLHACGFVATSTYPGGQGFYPTARGFRCCRELGP